MTKSRWRYIAWFLAIVVLLVVVKRMRHRGGADRVRATVDHLISPLWRGGRMDKHWAGRLDTPTQITKLGSLYFIADCFHNRVIYSSAVDAPLTTWRVVDRDLAGPHSIATDSVLYLVDDTGRNSLRVYRYQDGKFERVQTFSGLGRRTHRVRYDSATNAFYALSANSQMMTKLVRRGEKLEIVYEKPLPFLNGAGTRSFTFDDGYMLFVSGPTHPSITKVRYLDDSYMPVASYAVPAAVRGSNGMNDIFKSGGYYYVTASPRIIVRAKSLEALAAGQWENLYGKLGFKGTPYYLDEFDGRIWVPQIEEYSGVVSFVADGDAIEDVRTQFNSGSGNWNDVEVMMSEPK